MTINGVTLTEQRRATVAGARLPARQADATCGTCAYWLEGVCDVWGVPQPAAGWCQSHKRWVERGSVLGRRAGR